MHNPLSAISLKSTHSHALFPPPPPSFTNKNPRISPYASTQYSCRLPVFTCRGIEMPFPKHTPNSIPANAGDDFRPKSVGVKEIDVATLGNLCVDIVLSVPELPPKNLVERKAYMDQLSRSPPDKTYWEAGGNCNMAIAAARIGLRVASIGHVGDEMYGNFLLDVLHGEGISTVEINDQKAVLDGLRKAYETLLCWVLVDPLHKHGFCSQADFSEGPAFSWMSKLSTEAQLAIRKSKIIFCNGYGFDELPPGLLASALDYAIEVGAAVFFDPGPRGKSLLNGTLEEQRALEKYMRMSDVLLLTSEEAESLTGIKNPIVAGQDLLRQGIRTKWVIIKMGRKGSILITPSSISCAPAFKVDVVDTVGCGDSFVAAIAFGYIQRLPLVHTLTFANAVGAATAMGCGAGRNVATMRRVMELMNGSDLNEDDKYWEELLKEHLDVNEITLLATNVRSNSSLKSSSLQKVAREVLPELESIQTKQVGSCR